MWLCHEREGGRGHFLLLLKAHWKLVGKSSSILIAIYLSSESCKTSLPVQVFGFFFSVCCFEWISDWYFLFLWKKTWKNPFLQFFSILPVIWLVIPLKDCSVPIVYLLQGDDVSKISKRISHHFNVECYETVKAEIQGLPTIHLKWKTKRLKVKKRINLL